MTGLNIQSTGFKHSNNFIFIIIFLFQFFCHVKFLPKQKSLFVFYRSKHNEIIEILTLKACLGLFNFLGQGPEKLKKKHDHQHSVSQRVTSGAATRAEKSLKDSNLHKFMVALKHKSKVALYEYVNITRPNLFIWKLLNVRIFKYYMYLIK